MTDDKVMEDIVNKAIDDATLIPLPEDILKLTTIKTIKEYLYPDGDKKPYNDAVMRYLHLYQYCQRQGYDCRQFKRNLESVLNG